MVDGMHLSLITVMKVGSGGPKSKHMLLNIGWSNVLHSMIYQIWLSQRNSNTHTAAITIFQIRHFTYLFY
jgi:hypothetical protein